MGFDIFMIDHELAETKLKKYSKYRFSRKGTKRGQPPAVDVLSALRSGETSKVRMKRTCDD